MFNSYHRGIDYFTRDLNKKSKDPLYCLVCRTKLDMKQSNGARSWVGAISGSKSKHWSYYCPNTKYKGHSHLVALYLESEKLIAQCLKRLVLDELDMERAIFLNGPKMEE